MYRKNIYGRDGKFSGIEEFPSDEKELLISQVSWEQKVGMLFFDEVMPLDKYGVIRGITPAAVATEPADLWEFGDVVPQYPDDTDGTDPIAYLSSSSAADTMNVEVQGLDVDGKLVSQVVTLAGQANVTLTTPLWRVFRMENDGSVNAVGIIYCHTSPTNTNGVPPDVSVRAIINNGNNQTLMPMYTIPKDWVGFLKRGELGLEFEGSGPAANEFAKVGYRSKRFGKVYKNKKQFSLGTSAGLKYSDKRTFSDIIPELTDIRLSVFNVTNTLSFWGAFDLEIWHKSVVPEKILAKIGML